VENPGEDSIIPEESTARLIYGIRVSNLDSHHHVKPLTKSVSVEISDDYLADIAAKRS
jgi:hypothetical protein